MITCDQCSFTFEPPPDRIQVFFADILCPSVPICPRCLGAVVPLEQASALVQEAAHLGIHFDGYERPVSGLQFDQDYPRDSAPEGA